MSGTIFNEGMFISSFSMTDSEKSVHILKWEKINDRRENYKLIRINTQKKNRKKYCVYYLFSIFIFRVFIKSLIYYPV